MRGDGASFCFLLFFLQVINFIRAPNMFLLMIVSLENLNDQNTQNTQFSYELNTTLQLQLF